MIIFDNSYIILYAIKIIKNVPGYSLSRAYEIFNTDYPRFMMYYNEIYNQQKNIEELNKTLNIAIQTRIIEDIKQEMTRLFKLVTDDLRTKFDDSEGWIDVRDIEVLNWKIELGASKSFNFQYDYNDAVEYEAVVPEEINGELTGNYVTITQWEPKILSVEETIYYYITAWSTKKYNKYFSAMTEDREKLRNNIYKLARMIAQEEKVRKNTGAVITAILLGLER